MSEFNIVDHSCDNSSDIHIENQVYMQSVRQNTDAFLRTHGIKPGYFIKTYGCQMNEHDSEKLSAMLVQMGYQQAESDEKADVIIFNTCCVRENAELKVYGNLGALKQLKKSNPHLILAVCGCMMQQGHVVEEIKTKYSHVDLVFGTHNLHTFPKLLQQAIAEDDMIIEVWESESEIVEGLPVIRKKSIKAFVNIMYGCNNFCTFCIVPYTRGRERSRMPADILNEVSALIAEGVKEITLLGQNVNSYGNDFNNNYTFAQLLHEIDAIAGQFRLRFMTAHPKDLSDDVISAIEQLPSVCESVHLPIQAGSDSLLKAMNRRYTRQQYLDIVSNLKSRIPDVTLSTDIMIGFPNETEADIDQLIDLIERVRYDSAFTFIYSIRKGTPAAKMDNQIEDTVKHARFDRMLKALNDIVIENNIKQVGQTFEVLIEGQGRDPQYLMGRTRNNRLIHFVGEADLIGQFATVLVTEAKQFSLYGKLL